MRNSGKVGETLAEFAVNSAEVGEPRVKTEVISESDPKKSGRSRVGNRLAMNADGGVPGDVVDTLVENRKGDSFAGINFDSPGGAPICDRVNVGLNAGGVASRARDRGPDGNVISELRDTDWVGRGWYVIDIDVKKDGAE